MDLTRKNATIIFFQESVKKAQCLSCNAIWTPRVFKPKNCPYCRASLKERKISRKNSKIRSIFDIPRKDSWTGYLKNNIQVVRDRFKISIPEVGSEINVFDLQTGDILCLNNIHPRLIISIINSIKNLNQCFTVLKKKFGKAKSPFTPEEEEALKKQEIRVFGKPLDDDWIKKHRWAIN